MPDCKDRRVFVIRDKTDHTFDVIVDVERQELTRAMIARAKWVIESEHTVTVCLVR